VIEHAPAKINVCLFVGPRRGDGRHELVTVFQAISLGDDIELEETGTDEVVCPGVDGPNLAREAIAAFRAALESRGVRVTVRLTRGREIAAACGQLAAARGAAA
jgi:4-diphosphocytidyl-2-C-methyl-D-erythritol kinase